MLLRLSIRMEIHTSVKKIFMISSLKN